MGWSSWRSRCYLLRRASGRVGSSCRASEVRTPQSIPVLIVGGGPVGLTASILLSRHGVRSLLAERHPGTAVHPKARAINARSMEMLPPVRASRLPSARPACGPEHTGSQSSGRGRSPARRSSAACRGAPRPESVAAQPGAQLPVRPGRPRARAARRSPSARRPGELRFNTEAGTCVEDERRRHRDPDGSRSRQRDTRACPVRDRRRWRAERDPPRARH